jgi:hypothetical protein
MVPLIQMVFILAIAGVFLWGLTQFPTLDSTIKQIIKVLVVVIASVWVQYILMAFFGVPLPSLRG